MHIRLARPLSLTAACCAIVALAGCSSGGSGGSPPAGSGGSSAGGGGNGAQTTADATQVIARAASQARATTSFTATLDITSTGTYASHMTGTLAEQTKPSLLAQQKFQVTGSSAPTTMETLLTSKAVYLKLSSLAHLTGKPWTVLPFSALKKSVGASFAPLIRQLQTNNPLELAQLLPASANVHRVGSATVAGVATTEYAGTYSIAGALAKLGKGLRKSLEPTLAATGLTTANFKVWVDGQGQIRQLEQVEGGGAYRVHSTVVITSINQPVSIKVPPSSQVGTMPGM